MKKNGSATLHIEYMPLTDLISRLDEANPKDHDLGALHTSMDKFGYVEIPVLNEATGKLVAGHGRIETLMQKKQSHMPAPARIDVRNDDWYVPVQRGVAFKNEREARAYLIASNRLTVLGGWHEAELAALLESLRSEDESLMHAAGYSDEDLEGLLRDLGQGILADTPQDAGAQLDKAAELQAKWQVQAGQVWEIGKHRLMCGDCTNPKDVARLVNGDKVSLVVTDPPYGVSYADKNAMLNAFGGGNRVQEPIANDHLSKEATQALWKSAFAEMNNVMGRGAVVYCFMPQGGDQMMMMMMMMMGAGIEPRHELIWLKNNHVLGRTDYAYKHEPILYAWKEGGHKFYGDFQTSVIEVSRPLKSEFHPTMKPVELIVKLIKNSSLQNEKVYDPFLGSGTTMVAAEQTGRICYGMEIEPKYCAVILDRMERMELTPVLTHDFQTAR